MQFGRYLLTCTKVTGLTIVLVVCVGLVYSVFALILSKDFRDRTFYLFGLPALANAIDGADYLRETSPIGRRIELPDGYADYINISQDHVAISRWILPCLSG